MPFDRSACPTLAPSRPAPTTRTVPESRGATAPALRAVGALVVSVIRSPCSPGASATPESRRDRVRSAPSSILVSSRVFPAGRVPRWSGPNCRRTSSVTGWPTAASIRRTMRLRPECRVSSTRLDPREVSSRRRLVGRDRTVLELDALRELRDRLASTVPSTLAIVDLGHPEGRVGEHVRERAVVGEDQQTAGLRVECGPTL